MKAFPAMVFGLAALAGGAAAADGSEYVLRLPLYSNTALNGNMFTNETEILTPRGIIDEPDLRLMQAQQPAAGPVPGVAGAVPMEEEPLSPQAVSPATP